MSSFDLHPSKPYQSFGLIEMLSQASPSDA